MTRRTNYFINGIQIGLSVIAISVGGHYWGCAGFGAALGVCMIAGSLLHWLVDMKIDETETTVEVRTLSDEELFEQLQELQRKQ